ncbi:hypothetical protein SERLA73DRAFT_174525 [Serpula lacrymans var. lacrymans S7.3]|uniref:Signal recognition particle subunit SRP14 n=2 Tax=Serpula lacrymans var. lacrymans TaxID=341189 RepID=F8PGF4_SERL3|nr:uncharacterized protein SERLADRAFT_456100 [Serpula lacrymans var. lacrymans S7.9]EGO05387.1 hypothetical protein SERLA73DRAFT_174525 [Serpula lacrymans var. lacrymans S7.3]EGO31239.1 hypothetical protein SERLADRAFT_456100 [Serpula lacrymans var. lacrymans S7.9]
MQLVDNSTFLTRLAAEFESHKEKGTIWLTHKRLTHDGEDATMNDADGTREYPCLVRATDGKKVKFSTQVESKDLMKFHSAYGSLLKSSMTTLRKRDKKREKQRAEELARRKRRMAEQIVVEGPKRGNGRRKRQRKMKAIVKQEELKERVRARDEAKARSVST